MSSFLNYPPVIESKLASFIKDKDKASLSIIIYFKLSKAVAWNDFNGMGLKLKTITTGTEKYNGATTSIEYDVASQRYYANFTLQTSQMAQLITGQFYKAQLSFIKYETDANNNIKDSLNILDRSPWSSVGIIKCTAPIELSIDDLESDVNNNNPVDFLGRYINADTTEKVYSYCFTIYDENNQVFETSGEQIHNSNSDEIINQKYNAIDTWTLRKSLEKNKLYRVVYSITTINGYKAESSPYVIREANTVDANIPAKLLATLDPDNGCVSLRLIKPKEHRNETAFSGNFMISRYSENLNTWNQICKFNTLSQKPSEIGEIWTDYTIEHGVKYLYCIQAYNSNKLYSNRIIHVIGTENEYAETDNEGNPYYIMADFEDAFLTDGDRQLKIRYNPKVSSFKPTILESKIDTLGGKYPFIFRNGNVEYKEFPISGLLSYLSDEKELFMKGIKPEEIDLKRSAAARSQVPEAGTKLTSDNFYRERQFKMAALEWLTNGQPKLFRSPGEGNYIVRLMNVSLSPNDTLGRMLHTFNTTAYEIAEHSFENLQKYNLLHLPSEDNRAMKFVEQLIGEKYEPHHGMHNVFIVDAPPNTKYRITQIGITPDPTIVIAIGATGAYYFDSDSAAIAKIELLEGDATRTAKVNYGYYDTVVPDYFSFIANVSSKDEMSQIIGSNENTEIISTELEDIRRKVNRFYTLIVRPREIINIYSYAGDHYQDSNHQFKITSFYDLAIYYVVNEDKYYNGQPNRATDLGTEKPEQYFKLNDKYILDLSSGNVHLMNDPLGAASNPDAQKIFIPSTNSTYWVSNFGDVTSMYLSTGTYVELAYEVNEVLYTVEETDNNVKNKKLLWQTALAGSLLAEPTHTITQVKAAYNNYIEALEDALEEAHREEYNYVL